MSKIWSLRLLTTLLWVLTIVSAVYWTSRIDRPMTAAPADRFAGPTLAMDEPSQQLQLAHLLGGSGMAKVVTPPPAASRFTLAGVIASLEGQGAALISVDGQPARPFGIGMQIVSGYVLKAVGRRDAQLAENMRAPATVILTVPVAEQTTALDVANRMTPAVSGSEPLAGPVLTPAATLPAGTLLSAPPVPAVLGSLPAAPALLAAPTVTTPSVNPDVGQNGPPPRADVRRQGMALPR